MRYLLGILVVVIGILGGLANFSRSGAQTQVQAADATAPSNLDRSPVDLVLTSDEQWLLTANQTSNTISLVRVADGNVVTELPSGRRPTALALSPDGKRVVVSASVSGDLHLFELSNETLVPSGTVPLGFEPRGVALAPDGKLAYVALTAANSIAVVDLEQRAEVGRIEVGRWPRYLALSPDGSRLAAGCSGDGSVAVVDVASRKMLYQSKFVGLNIGHMQASSDGQYVYFPWMVYADRPITPGNIREGWVLGNRLARVRLDREARREAIALDPRGRAVADPHGIALSQDEQWVYMSASGSGELVAYHLPGVRLRPDGPGDHLDPAVGRDKDRFYRIDLGGRPMGIRASRDGQQLFVANYLKNAVQVVNLQERRLARSISLGGPAEPSLARRGETIFYDARRSVDQWYSCHSCHYEGDTNAVTMDTTNDGTHDTYKTVLSLYNVTRTGPWTWHGWQDDLKASLEKSLTETMRGPEPTEEDVNALLAFFETLAPPANPYRQADGSLPEAALRGKQVFESADAGCSICHQGEYLTDGEIHDVGLGSPYDAYEGFNTPSLLNIHNRSRYLHHGRAKTLEELLRGLHSPAKVSGTRELSPSELADLIEYLRCL